MPTLIGNHSVISLKVTDTKTSSVSFLHSGNGEVTLMNEDALEFNSAPLRDQYTYWILDSVENSRETDIFDDKSENTQISYNQPFYLRSFVNGLYLTYHPSVSDEQTKETIAFLSCRNDTPPEFYTWSFLEKTDEVSKFETSFKAVSTDEEIILFHPHSQLSLCSSSISQFFEESNKKHSLETPKKQIYLGYPAQKWSIVISPPSVSISNISRRYDHDLPFIRGGLFVSLHIRQNNGSLLDITMDPHLDPSGRDDTLRAIYKPIPLDVEHCVERTPSNHFTRTLAENLFEIELCAEPTSTNKSPQTERPNVVKHGSHVKLRHVLTQTYFGYKVSEGTGTDHTDATVPELFIVSLPPPCDSQKQVELSDVFFLKPVPLPDNLQSSEKGKMCVLDLTDSPHVLNSAEGNQLLPFFSVTQIPTSFVSLIHETRPQLSTIRTFSTSEADYTTEQAQTLITSCDYLSSFVSNVHMTTTTISFSCRPAHHLPQDEVDQTSADVVPPLSVCQGVVFSQKLIDLLPSCLERILSILKTKAALSTEPFVIFFIALLKLLTRIDELSTFLRDNKDQHSNLQKALSTSTLNLYIAVVATCHPSFRTTIPLSLIQNWKKTALNKIKDKESEWMTLMIVLVSPRWITSDENESRNHDGSGANSFLDVLYLPAYFLDFDRMHNLVDAVPLIPTTATPHDSDPFIQTRNLRSPSIFSHLSKESSPKATPKSQPKDVPAQSQETKESPKHFLDYFEDLDTWTTSTIYYNKADWVLYHPRILQLFLTLAVSQRQLIVNKLRIYLSEDVIDAALQSLINPNSTDASLSQCCPLLHLFKLLHFPRDDITTLRHRTHDPNLTLITPIFLHESTKSEKQHDTSTIPSIPKAFTTLFMLIKSRLPPKEPLSTMSSHSLLFLHTSLQILTYAISTDSFLIQLFVSKDSLANVEKLLELLMDIVFQEAYPESKLKPNESVTLQLMMSFSLHTVSDDPTGSSNDLNRSHSRLVLHVCDDILSLLEQIDKSQIHSAVRLYFNHLQQNGFPKSSSLKSPQTLQTIQNQAKMCLDSEKHFQATFSEEFKSLRTPVNHLFQRVLVYIATHSTYDIRFFDALSRTTYLSSEEPQSSDQPKPSLAKHILTVEENILMMELERHNWVLLKLRGQPVLPDDMNKQSLEKLEGNLQSLLNELYFVPPKKPREEVDGKDKQKVEGDEKKRSEVDEKDKQKVEGDEKKISEVEWSFNNTPIKQRQILFTECGGIDVILRVLSFCLSDTHHFFLNQYKRLLAVHRLYRGESESTQTDFVSEIITEIENISISNDDLRRHRNGTETIVARSLQLLYSAVANNLSVSPMQILPFLVVLCLFKTPPTGLHNLVAILLVQLRSHDNIDECELIALVELGVAVLSVLFRMERHSPTKIDSDSKQNHLFGHPIPILCDILASVTFINNTPLEMSQTVLHAFLRSSHGSQLLNEGIIAGKKEFDENIQTGDDFLSSTEFHISVVSLLCACSASGRSHQMQIFCRQYLPSSFLTSQLVNLKDMLDIMSQQKDSSPTKFVRILRLVQVYLDLIRHAFLTPSKPHDSYSMYRADSPPSLAYIAQSSLSCSPSDLLNIAQLLPVLNFLLPLIDHFVDKRSSINWNGSKEITEENRVPGLSPILRIIFYKTTYPPTSSIPPGFFTIIEHYLCQDKDIKPLINAIIRFQGKQFLDETWTSDFLGPLSHLILSHFPPEFDTTELVYEIGKTINEHYIKENQPINYEVLEIYLTFFGDCISSVKNCDQAISSIRPVFKRIEQNPSQNPLFYSTWCKFLETNKHFFPNTNWDIDLPDKYPNENSQSPVKYTFHSISFPETFDPFDSSPKEELVWIRGVVLFQVQQAIFSLPILFLDTILSIQTIDFIGKGMTSTPPFQLSTMQCTAISKISKQHEPSLSTMLNEMSKKRESPNQVANPSLIQSIDRILLRERLQLARQYRLRIDLGKIEDSHKQPPKQSQSPLEDLATNVMQLFQNKPMQSVTDFFSTIRKSFQDGKSDTIGHFSRLLQSPQSSLISEFEGGKLHIPAIFSNHSVLSKQRIHFIVSFIINTFLLYIHPTQNESDNDLTFVQRQDALKNASLVKSLVSVLSAVSSPKSGQKTTQTESLTLSIIHLFLYLFSGQNETIHDSNLPKLLSDIMEETIETVQTIPLRVQSVERLQSTLLPLNSIFLLIHQLCLSKNQQNQNLLNISFDPKSGQSNLLTSVLRYINAILPTESSKQTYFIPMVTKHSLRQVREGMNSTLFEVCESFFSQQLSLQRSSTLIAVPTTAMMPHDIVVHIATHVGTIATCLRGPNFSNQAIVLESQLGLQTLSRLFSCPLWFDSLIQNAVRNEIRSRKAIKQGKTSEYKLKFTDELNDIRTTIQDVLFISETTNFLRALLEGPHSVQNAYTILQSTTVQQSLERRLCGLAVFIRSNGLKFFSTEEKRGQFWKICLNCYVSYRELVDRHTEIKHMVDERAGAFTGDQWMDLPYLEGDNLEILPAHYPCIFEPLFSKHVTSVEIERDGVLRSIYFPIPEQSTGLTNQDRKHMIDSLEHDNMISKLTTFQSECNPLYSVSVKRYKQATLFSSLPVWKTKPPVSEKQDKMILESNPPITHFSSQQSTSKEPSSIPQFPTKNSAIPTKKSAFLTKISAFPTKSFAFLRFLFSRTATRHFLTILFFIFSLVINVYYLIVFRKYVDGDIQNPFTITFGILCLGTSIILALSRWAGEFSQNRRRGYTRLKDKALLEARYLSKDLERLRNKSLDGQEISDFTQAVIETHKFDIFHPGINKFWLHTKSVLMDVLLSKGVWVAVILIVASGFGLNEMPGFYILLLFDILTKFDGMRVVLSSIRKPLTQIALTLGLVFLMVYFFAVIGMMIFADSFVLSKTDPYGERICSSIATCFVVLLASLPTGGKWMEARFLFWKYDGSLRKAHYHAYSMVYILLFYMVCLVILFAIICGYIVDKFDELSGRHDREKKSKRELCFACGLNAKPFAAEGLSFDEHRHSTHNPWRYFALFIHLKESAFGQKSSERRHPQRLYESTLRQKKQVVKQKSHAKDESELASLEKTIKRLDDKLDDLKRTEASRVCTRLSKMSGDEIWLLNCHLTNDISFYPVGRAIVLEGEGNNEKDDDDNTDKQNEGDTGEIQSVHSQLQAEEHSLFSQLSKEKEDLEKQIAQTLQITRINVR
ncbi:putative inositol 1,4,5-triphosphate receptor [Blattamonas nauphoetae]|uniref:Inositol 1,4,5-triphosphate receptor n=1 Tax=Blattamonas nauphoetae TaxID=2049346 RepID=A0ABQ9XM55_9EUKA|nr:putative inositol 1,4,5-triphosphate receptor [Blattamonas nauphoetae]